MRNKKKGFTLIELLAVIVILAIITIIAVPKILNVIENSERKAFSESAGLMARAAQLKYSQGNLTSQVGDETYIYENGELTNNSPELTFKGDKPNSGTIVQKNGRVTLAVISKNKKWCAIKNEGQRLAKVYKIGDEINSEDCKIGYTGEENKDDPNKGQEPDNDDDSNISCPKSNQTITSNIVCKRAAKLHTEECMQTDEKYYCSGAGYTMTGSKGTTTIKYGNCGTSGTLKSGDAFDCDVNGDGTFDEQEERFYYVSDYYNGSTNSFENDTAVLIYYKNSSKNYSYTIASTFYSDNYHSIEGPITAVKDMPTTSEWSNVSLKNETRQIVNENGINNAAYREDSSSVMFPISTFSYKGYAARLLTFQELKTACNTNIGSSIIGELDSCSYLFEKTYFSSEDNLITVNLLETPLSSYYMKSWNLSSSSRFAYTPLINSGVSGKRGTRPVIEVPKSNILY